MCGIAGFNFKDEQLIKKMNISLAHRGPDGDGVYLDENFSLGHRRLAIIDLSEAGRQPMPDESGRYWIIFNGEIYNFQEIRKELAKYKFRSQTDTEVIIYAYKEWGAECLKKFNGIFSFAIWDKERRELFLARDSAGVKPLYYFYDGKKFIFASEIKAILQADVPREISYEALNLYLRLLYVPAPFTMFKNIKKLSPGSYLTYQDGRIDIKKYWEIKDFANFGSSEGAKAEILNIIKDSVRLELVSDRPVGIFLSGGIDSTAILGIVREIAPHITKTYSVGFDIREEDNKYNTDFELAKKTAEYYGTDHYEFLVSGRDVADNLERIVWHLDEPVANATVIPTYLLAHEARRQVTVVLGGDGGDELFGGYSRYYYVYRANEYLKWLPLSVQTALLKKIIGKFSAQKLHKIKDILSPPFYQENFKEFLNTNFVQTGGDWAKSYMLFDLKNWLVDESLLRTDKMTMAHGLEQRVPILDSRLIQAAFKISSQWKIDNINIGKKIWREAVDKYLPPHIKSEKKRGWFSPAAKWLRRELKDFAYDAIDSLDSDLFNRKKCLQILDKHISGKEYNLNIIWALLIWQIWRKTFIKISKI